MTNITQVQGLIALEAKLNELDQDSSVSNITWKVLRATLGTQPVFIVEYND